MNRVLGTGLAVVVLATVAAQAQAPATPNLQQRFMGALTTLNPLNTASIVYSGTGSAAVPSDGRKPATLAPITKYTVAINYGMNMTRVDIERAGAPRRVTQFLANDVAWDVVDGRRPTAKPGAAAERLRLMFMTPHGAMRAGFDPAAKRTMTTEAGLDGKPVVVALFQAAGVPLKAYFDGASLITKVQTATGDIEFLYSGYKDVDTITPPAVKPPGGAPAGGILFPTRIVQKVAGQTVLDVTLTDITPNVGLYLEVPEAVEKAMGKK